MSQAGFTPIQLYRTTTAAAVPTAGNLAAGELAINLTDKKLYAKDASNNVFLLADASSGGTTAANLAGGAAGSLPYQTGANATTFRAIGTAGQVLQVNSGATAPEWVSSSGTGNVARTTSPSFTTPSLGAATALSINSLTITTSTGTLTIANGKTVTINNTVTLNGTDATTMTFPSVSATLVGLDTTQTLTNKRYTPRIGTVASAGTITPTSDTVDQYNVTALATNATIAAPTGTPTDGQKLILRILDNGTSRNLTWTTSSGGYRGIAGTLPPATSPNLILYIGCIWNAAASYWDVIAIVQE